MVVFKVLVNYLLMFQPHGLSISIRFQWFGRHQGEWTTTIIPSGENYLWIFISGDSRCAYCGIPGGHLTTRVGVWVTCSDICLLNQWGYCCQQRPSIVLPTKSAHGAIGILFWGPSKHYQGVEQTFLCYRKMDESLNHNRRWWSTDSWQVNTFEWILMEEMSLQPLLEFVMIAFGTLGL
jgi:hypothetical protein